ncbi:MAG TPA: DNA-directed RNA polymerase subunit omega [Soehngenia sp.]|nr:DNA-directed RNA polymerase subunit omega [Soehngenia sp.]HPP31527.1 DNA-directed RNA polymerase subunit omega [Soehngenia sp.]
MNRNLDVFLNSCENKYVLATVAAKRARQIIDGSKPRVNSESNKPVCIALEEIAVGKVKYEMPTQYTSK